MPLSSRVCAPLQTYRVFVRVAFHVMFVPIVVNSLHSFDCTGTWLHTGWVCYTGPHLATVTLTVLILPPTLIFAMLGAHRVWLILFKCA